MGPTSGSLAGSVMLITLFMTSSCTAPAGAARVPDEPTNPAVVSECPGAPSSWIWCDDFEQDRLSSYFEYDDAGGRFTRVAGAGRSGSSGMRAQWTVGAQSAGSLHLAFGSTPQAYMDPVDAGTAKYREIYWRVYMRRQAGWTGGGGDKMSRAHIFASSTSFAQALAAHVWSGSGADASYLALDPASGTTVAGSLVATTYNDPNFRWLGAVRGNTAVFGPAAAGTWQCVEAHVRLNDAGQSNGAFDLWIDGAVEAQKSGMNWVGSFNAYGINAVYLENYWNAGSPAAQERYFDNFVVATGRIGC